MDVISNQFNTGIEDKGVHVSANAEVTVGGLNLDTPTTRQPATTDAFPALPTSMLGTDYVNLTFRNTFTGLSTLVGSGFAFVATQPDTHVTIVPSTTVFTRPAGVPYSLTLQRGQTHHLATIAQNTDLTGSTIVADKPIAVFGVHKCTDVPRSLVGACDILVEQLPPTTRRGRASLRCRSPRATTAIRSASWLVRMTPP
jgi:hypothetical protein